MEDRGQIPTDAIALTGSQGEVMGSQDAGKQEHNKIGNKENATETSGMAVDQDVEDDPMSPFLHWKIKNRCPIPDGMPMFVETKKRKTIPQNRDHFREELQKKENEHAFCFDGRSFLRRNLVYVLNYSKTSKNSKKRARNDFCVQIVNKLNEAVNGSRKTVVDPKNCADPICVFCGFDGATLSGLWAHLNASHDEHFKFSRRVTTDDSIHILAERKSSSNYCVEIPPYRRMSQLKGKRVKMKRAKAISLPIRKKPQSCLLFSYDMYISGNKSTMTILPPQLIETADHEPVRYRDPSNKQSQDLVMDLPKRQYFHSGTFEPYKIGEWVADVESEDEIDETWKYQLGDKQLDEFEDVSQKEKEFFKLWNRFIQSMVLVSEKDLPSYCLHFVGMYAQYICDHLLEEQLVWHLTNLWDEGHVGKVNISSCMKLYHQLTS